MTYIGKLSDGLDLVPFILQPNMIQLVSDHQLTDFAVIRLTSFELETVAKGRIVERYVHLKLEV